MTLIIRYFKKSDLPKSKKWEQILETISENEVFLTETSDVTFVDCINGNCEIYSYEEYDKLPVIGNAVFFSRFDFIITLNYYYKHYLLKINNCDWHLFISKN